MAQERNDNHDQQDGLTTQAVDSDQPGGDTPLDDNPDEGKVSFDDAQQQKLNAIIAKKTAKTREAEQRARDLEQRLKEVEAKIPQEKRPDVPDMPDAYDENFSQRMAAREQAIRQAAEFDAKQQYALQQQEQLRQQQLQAEQQRINGLVGTYSNNATKLGITEQELANAGAVVQSYGLNEQIAEVILQDDKGPLITKYLAANPLAAEELVNTPLYYQGSKLDAIKQQASKLQAKTSSAPPPVDPIRGNGVPDQVPAILKGARFE